MAFEQATIKVENAREFGELKVCAGARFSRPDRVTQYLKKLSSQNIRIRDFDAILAERVTIDLLAQTKLGTARGFVSVADGFRSGDRCASSIFRRLKRWTSAPCPVQKLYQYY